MTQPVPNSHITEGLQKAEAFLNLINDGCFILDEQWNFVYMNRAFEKICKCRKNDFIGRNYWEIYPKAVSLKFYTCYHKAMREKVKVHFEEYSSSLDKWVSVNAYPMGNVLTVYFTDITEERRLLEKVAHDEQNLLSLINNTSDLIWSVGLDFNIISANNAFTKWARSFLGTELSSGDYLFHPGFGTAVIERWQAYFEKAFAGESFSITEEFLRKGRIEYAEARISPIRDKEDHIIGASCTSRDITEQRKAFLTIQEQNNKLKEIAWLLSHKVRGPVASVLGLAQLFNTTDYADPTNKQVIDGIQESSELLDQIIREINGKTDIIEQEGRAQ